MNRVNDALNSLISPEASESEAGWSEVGCAVHITQLLPLFSLQVQVPSDSSVFPRGILKP